MEILPDVWSEDGEISMDDTISRKAAIETAKKMYVACDTNSIDDYEMLMEEALKVLPSALSTNLAEVGTDCISRQAAIDAVWW